MYKSPRIGLDLSHPGTTGPEVKPLQGSRIRFLPRRYRYFAHPSELVANGRAQTFLGIVYSRIPSDIDKGLNDRKILAEVVRLSGMKEYTNPRLLVLTRHIQERQAQKSNPSTPASSSCQNDIGTSPIRPNWLPTGAPRLSLASSIHAFLLTSTRA